MITLVFLSFHSAHHIRRLLSVIDQKFKIIVIENSSDSNLKDEIEKKYKNVHVEVCTENLGFSKGMNLGIQLSKTPFVFLNPADVEISNEVFYGLESIVEKFSDFAMLAPVYKDRSIHSNFFIWSKKNQNSDIEIQAQGKNFILNEVDFIDGTILINKEKIKNELFDENMFIYFETMDLSKRLISKNLKLYVCKNLKFNHYGGSSHEKRFNNEAKKFRNFHYNWSKFYYFKKHYNFLYALRKITPNFVRALKNYILSFFTKKEGSLERDFILAEIKGILFGIISKKSNKDY